MSAAKRGPNWTNEEDAALCEAWLNCSQDAIIGIHQKNDKLYERVHESFLAICKEKGLMTNHELRAPSGIKARWHVVSKACSKFAGVLAQVDKRQKSGASAQDNFNEALALYNHDTKTTFSYLSSFNVLQHAPKWQQYDSGLKNKSSQQGVKRKLGDTNTEEFDNEPSTSSQSNRPLGVKSSKAIMETNSSLTKSSSELAASAKQIARAAMAKQKLTKQKIAAMNRMTDMTIMTTDLGSLSETARAYIEMQQQQIWMRMQAESSGGQNSGDDDSGSEDLQEGTFLEENCDDSEQEQSGSDE